MITVKVKTSDSIVWNKEEVYAEISHAIFTNQSLTIDLMGEGPCFEALGIDDYLQNLEKKVDYSGTIEILTANSIESYQRHSVTKKFPNHLIKNSFDYDYAVVKTHLSKHFGLFIGRGNPARLYLSSYLYNHYLPLIVHTNHLDLKNEFYAANIGIEQFLLEQDSKNWHHVVKYIEQCPIAISSIIPDKSLDENHAQQLLNNDRDEFLKNYDKFAIEIVCDTYFRGRTFFPTEKIWRPIMLKTPFIVQGPTNFLKNLKQLGFKTFSDFWDEGYDEDPYPWSMLEITRVIDTLAEQPMSDLQIMINSMQDILEHNRSRLIELANESQYRNFADLF